MLFTEDCPRRAQGLPRALAAQVMAQLDRRGNLDRWDRPGYRLITMILMRCGLRISDACKIPSPCLVTDADGAPYLRYFNRNCSRISASRGSSAAHRSQPQIIPETTLSHHGNTTPAAKT